MQGDHLRHTCKGHHRDDALAVSPVRRDVDDQERRGVAPASALRLWAILLPRCIAPAIPAHVMERVTQLPGDHATATKQKRQNNRRHYRENDRPEAPQPIRVQADHLLSLLHVARLSYSSSSAVFSAEARLGSFVVPVLASDISSRAIWVMRLSAISSSASD